MRVSCRQWSRASGTAFARRDCSTHCVGCMSLSQVVAASARPGFWSGHGLEVTLVSSGSHLHSARCGATPACLRPCTATCAACRRSPSKGPLQIACPCFFCQDRESECMGTSSRPDETLSKRLRTKRGRLHATSRAIVATLDWRPDAHAAVTTPPASCREVLEQCELCAIDAECAFSIDRCRARLFG